MLGAEIYYKYLYAKFWSIGVADKKIVMSFVI